MMIKKEECKCLPEERRVYIENALSLAEDFPDGAWMAFLQEQGIDPNELEVFSVGHNCKGDQK